MKEDIEAELDKKIKDIDTLIIEATNVLKRLRKLVNIGIGVATVMVVPLFLSFMVSNERITRLEEKQMPKDDIYNKFVQKTDALALHMFENDWQRTQFYKITHDSTYKDDNLKGLIDAFFSEDSRGAH